MCPSSADAAPPGSPYMPPMAGPLADRHHHHHSHHHAHHQPLHHAAHPHQLHPQQQQQPAHQQSQPSRLHYPSFSGLSSLSGPSQLPYAASGFASRPWADVSNSQSQPSSATSSGEEPVDDPMDLSPSSTPRPPIPAGPHMAADRAGSPSSADRTASRSDRSDSTDRRNSGPDRLDDPSVYGADRRPLSAMSANAAAGRPSPTENGSAESQKSGFGPAGSLTVPGQANGQNPSKVQSSAFIHKLYAMLEDSKIGHLIYWSDSNDSFIMSPCTEFSKVLSSYFKHTNISSFVRQLNMYGFHKVVSDAFQTTSPDSPVWEFRHGTSSFKRGDLDGLRDIKRRASRHTLINRDSFSGPAGRLGPPGPGGMPTIGGPVTTMGPEHMHAHVHPATLITDPFDGRFVAVEQHVERRHYETHARIDDIVGHLNARVQMLTKAVEVASGWTDRMCGMLLHIIPDPAHPIRHDLTAIQREVGSHLEQLRRASEERLPVSFHPFSHGPHPLAHQVAIPTQAGHGLQPGGAGVGPATHAAPPGHFPPRPADQFYSPEGPPHSAASYSGPSVPQGPVAVPHPIHHNPHSQRPSVVANRPPEPTGAVPKRYSVGPPDSSPYPPYPVHPQAHGPSPAVHNIHVPPVHTSRNSASMMPPPPPPSSTQQPQHQPVPHLSVSSPTSAAGRRHTSADIRQHGWNNYPQSAGSTNGHSTLSTPIGGPTSGSHPWAGSSQSGSTTATRSERQSIRDTLASFNFGGSGMKSERSRSPVGSGGGESVGGIGRKSTSPQTGSDGSTRFNFGQPIPTSVPVGSAGGGSNVPTPSSARPFGVSLELPPLGSSSNTPGSRRSSMASNVHSLLNPDRVMDDRVGSPSGGVKRQRR